MTLLPLPTTQLVGVVGKPYQVGPYCAVPGCGHITEHGHHIWGRGSSGKKGGYFWIQLPDGQVVGNLVGLCAPCHDLVTGRIGGHKCWIQWRDGQFVWGKNLNEQAKHPHWEDDFAPIGPLDPQPPAPDLLDVSQPDAESEPDRCPECGQRRRRAPAIGAAGARRRRKSWIVKVPDDHEDGADVLDTLVDDLAPLLGIDPTASGRYHVLVPVLVYAHQDERGFIEAIKGIGGKEA